MRAPPQACADALVRLTLQRGATDNVTVLVVACRAQPG
jgi:serine/threonine protein phosphatase PrpC